MQQLYNFDLAPHLLKGAHSELAPGLEKAYEILVDLTKHENAKSRNRFVVVISDGDVTTWEEDNIWATYTFGPNNSIYIGAYRGFLKFSSDPRPSIQ